MGRADKPRMSHLRGPKADLIRCDIRAADYRCRILERHTNEFNNQARAALAFADAMTKDFPNTTFDKITKINHVAPSRHPDLVDI